MNARQAAKKWKKKCAEFEAMIIRPIPWTYYKRPIKEYACARLYSDREWCEILSSRGAYERIVNDCAYEIGKAALNNSWWQVERNCLYGVRLLIRTQIVDDSDGNPLPQNLKEMEGR